MFLLHNLMLTDFCKLHCLTSCLNLILNWKNPSKMWNVDMFITMVFNSKPFYKGHQKGCKHCHFLHDSHSHRAHINTFYWCFPDAQRGSRKRAPVCVLLCRCSSSLRVNLFPQNIQLQTKGRSPECQRRCARRCEVFPYTFPQPAMWQMCCFFFPVLDPLRKTSMESYGPLQSHTGYEDLGAS